MGRDLGDDYMQIIYRNDANNDLGYISVTVADDYQLLPIETVTPPENLIPPLQIVNGQWVGQIFETNNTPVLTPDQKLIMTQAKQITTMQQMLMAQATDIAKLKQGVDKP